MATDLAGSLLVRAGLVTRAQLDAAHDRCKASGATLIEELVAGGLAETTLCDFFGQKLLVPRMGRAALQKISPKVINLLPRELAAEFFAVPVSMDREQNLLVAMADPSDTRAVDEIAFFTGAYVMRAVAPASDLAWAIAHYYQIESPLLPSHADEPSAGGSATPVTARAAGGEPGPAAALPLPAPDPGSSEPVIMLDARKKKTAVAPEAEPRPAVEAAIGAPIVAPIVAPIGKRRRAVVVEDLFGEETPLPAPVPLGATGPVEIQVLPAATGKRKKRATLAGVGALGATEGKRPAPRPITAVTADKLVADCRSALAEANDRDAVVDALVALLAALYRRAAFFALRRDQLTGWRAAGSGPDPVAFRHVVIELEQVPALQDAIETRLPRLGPPDDATQAALASPMGGALADTLVLPLALRERAVGVAVADGAVLSFSPADLVDLGHEAARALERVISSKKLGA
jgi:hypothetical protein